MTADLRYCPNLIGDNGLRRAGEESLKVIGGGEGGLYKVGQVLNVCVCAYVLVRMFLCVCFCAYVFVRMCLCVCVCVGVSGGRVCVYVCDLCRVLANDKIIIESGLEFARLVCVGKSGCACWRTCWRAQNYHRARWIRRQCVLQLI